MSGSSWRSINYILENQISTINGEPMHTRVFLEQATDRLARLVLIQNQYTRRGARRTGSQVVEGRRGRMNSNLGGETQ
jgi:hypothetical protein